MKTFDNLSYEANKEKQREMKDAIVEQVKEKFSERSRVGIEKYGKTLQENDIDTLSWVNHLQEELMDAILYAEKLKVQLSQSDMLITKESWIGAEKITHNGYLYVRVKDLKFV